LKTEKKLWGFSSILARRRCSWCVSREILYSTPPPNLVSYRIGGIGVSGVPHLWQAVSHLAACLLTYSILKAWEPQCSRGSGQDPDSSGRNERRPGDRGARGARGGKRFQVSAFVCGKRHFSP